MSILRIEERVQGRAPTDPRRAAGLSKLTENLCAIVTAWEALSSEAWNGAAIQSFATQTRRNALELPSFGCGALERTLVELVLALDALALAETVTAQQLDRVDHVMALIRAVTVQRILASEVAAIAIPGEAPVFCGEPCARCSGAAACALLR